MKPDVPVLGTAPMNTKLSVSRWWRRVLNRQVQVSLDVGVLTIAFLVSYELRFEFSIPGQALSEMVSQWPLVLSVQVGALYLCGAYNLIWRYVSMSDLRRFLAAAVLALAPIVAFRLGLPRSLQNLRVPISVSIIDAVMGFGGIVGLRILRRTVYERFERGANNKLRAGRKRRPVLLVGAGAAGVLAAKEIGGRGDLEIEVKGFVDDDSMKVGWIVNDVKVLGTTEDLPRLVRELEIDHVVITIATASRGEIRRIVEICERAGTKARIIPGLYEILDGRVSVTAIRDVDIEDLLGRESVHLDEIGLFAYIGGRTVMVTGAGGSIGSELARQVLRFGPGRLLLVERSEPALFSIEQELLARKDGIEIVPLIGDVGDGPRMEGIMKGYHPDVVIHAAAHKHVPMMETNVCEAVKNNSIGTRRLAEISGAAGVESFVLISTDKAVNPSSVMGASKRVAELAVQGLGGRFRTRFVAVRFGNVLGSAGSVVPVFREQIRNGGPVTVTDPEMKRYFMTIPEAAQLVLQAGALGLGGEIFILDMGEPVSVLALAADMIRLSGLKPYEDIDIVFTGLRPGEKLYEELATTEENVEKTRHPKIFIGKVQAPDSGKVESVLRRLEETAVAGDEAGTRELLQELVPEATVNNGKDASRRTGIGASRIVVALLSFFLAGSRAAAQLSTEAPARARTVPVAEQVKDESENPRFRLGPFRMRPVFGLREAGYNNNVFGSEVNKVADWTFTAFAGVKYLLPSGPKTYLRGVAVPEYSWYNKLSQYRNFGGTYSAAILGLYNRMSVELGGNGQRTLTVVNSEAQQLARQDTLGGGLKLEVEILRRLSLYAGLEGVKLRYDDSGFPVSDFNVVTNLNRSEIAGRGGVRYQFSETLSLALQAEQARTQFVNQAQDRDNDATSYVAVVRVDKPRFYIDLTGGYRSGTARYSDSFFPPYRTGSYGFFASYVVNRSLELQGFGWRRPINSLFLDNPYYFETRNGGGVSVGLGARVAIRGFVLVGSNSYPVDVLVNGAPVRRADDVTTFGGGFSFQFYRTAKLLVQGASDRYRSNVPGGDRSIFRLSTGLSFEGETAR